MNPLLSVDHQCCFVLQLAHLVSLRLVLQVGTDLCQPHYKCNVTHAFIAALAAKVDFNLPSYVYQ